MTTIVIKVGSRLMNVLYASTIGSALALGGCNTHGERHGSEEERGIQHGSIEVGVAGNEAACLDGALEGMLALENTNDGTLTMLPGNALCGSVARRELPAGLYTLRWMTAESDDGESPRWMIIRDPAVISVFSQRTTTLKLHVPSGEGLLSRNE